MNRFLNIALFGVVSVVVANAGPILIGQYAGNLSSGVNSGLTAAYINGTAGVECAGEVLQGNPCVAGSTTGFGGTNYESSTLQHVAGTPNVYAGYSNTSTTAGSTAVDGAGVTFAMVADTAGATRNDWTSVSTDVLTIPIGIFDVTDVSTMLNDLYGPAGAQDTTLYFNFSSTASNATTGLTVVEVQLTNAGAYGSAASGQIRSATTCILPGTSVPPVYVNCSGLAGGSLATNSNATAYTLTGATQNESALSGTAGTVAVTTSNVYSSVYSGLTSASYEYYGTSGTQQLDAQDFSFGSLFQNDYLVSIGVQDSNELIPNSAGGNANASAVALSAISVDSGDPPAVPEPSTWILFLGGIGAVGLGRFRRVS